MPTLIHQRVVSAQAGQNPTVVCRVPSGWVVMCDVQYLRGYSILLPDPVVPDLNALNTPERVRFLLDMTIAGDALLEVTKAIRINYEILGNLEPALHAHVVPRFEDEPEGYKFGPPFFYPSEHRNAIRFDAEHERELMGQLAGAIGRRLAA